MTYFTYTRLNLYLDLLYFYPVIGFKHFEALFTLFLIHIFEKFANIC